MRISDWSSDVCSSDLRLMSQPIERFGVISGMITTAENLPRDYGITRAEADAYAARSHQRAAAAWRDGKFGDEGGAVPDPPRGGGPNTVDHDGGYRGDGKHQQPDGTKPPEAGGL